MRELAGLSFEQIAAAFDTSPAVARQTALRGASQPAADGSEGREMRCEEVCRALSDGDRRSDPPSRHPRPPARLPRLPGLPRRHRRPAAATSPRSHRFRLAAAAGLLHGILGSANGAARAPAWRTAGGAGAGKALAGSALVKSAATVAVVAAVGVSAADRGGLIHVLPAGGDRQQREAQGSPEGSDQGTPATDQGAGALGGATSAGNATRRGAARASIGEGGRPERSGERQRSVLADDWRERKRKRAQRLDGLCPRQRNSRQPFPSTPRASHSQLASGPWERVEIVKGKRRIPRQAGVAPVPAPINRIPRPPAPTRRLRAPARSGEDTAGRPGAKAEHRSHGTAGRP